MANLTDREKLIASTFSIVDVWVSHLEENGMDASEAIALREKSLSEGKTEEEFMAWCESNKLSQEEPVPMGYSTMEEYNAKQYQRDRQYPALGEQLDMLFHDMTAGKGTKDGEWYKAVAKVKTDNPKPTE